MINQKVKQIKFKRWELRKAIIKIILMSVVIGGSSSRPILPLMIKSIIKLLKEDFQLAVKEEKVKRVLNSLERNEIITLTEEGNNVFVQTVDKDSPVVIKYSIKILLDLKKKEKQWKGKWYLVFFDVPETQRNKRNYLRHFLTKIGFYQYQKSVYIFPYECEEEVKLIKKIIEAGKYMKYLIAEKIEDEEKIKIFFNLL